MTDTENNDRPSEWPMISRKQLDELLPKMVAICYGDSRHADGTELTHKEKQDFADSVANRIDHELAKAAAYDAAMAKIESVLSKWDHTAPETMKLALQDHAKAERDAGRFNPQPPSAGDAENGE